MRVVAMALALVALGLTARGGSNGSESKRIASVVDAERPPDDEHVERQAAGGASGLQEIDSGAAGSDVVSDDFERPALGPSWNIHFGNPGIVRGSDLGLLSGTFALLSWAASVPADQFSEAQISANADQADKGVFVRRRASDGARYQFHFDTNGTEDEPRPHWQIKYDGVPTPQTRILARNLSAPAPSPGDVLRIEAQGKEIRGYVNGQRVLAAQDSALSGGSVGVALLKLGGVTAPTAIFERWAGGRLPRIVGLRRSGSLVLYPTRRSTCFSVRFVPNTRVQHTFMVTNARARVVWKDVGLGVAGRPTVIKWCGRTKAKTPTQGKPLPVGRYRAKLEVSVAPAGEPPAPIAFVARTWPLEIRT